MVFQQVSCRPNQRRVATWCLWTGRRVYITNVTAPLNPYAARSPQAQCRPRGNFTATGAGLEHKHRPNMSGGEVTNKYERLRKETENSNYTHIVLYSY